MEEGKRGKRYVALRIEEIVDVNKRRVRRWLIKSKSWVEEESILG